MEPRFSWIIFFIKFIFKAIGYYSLLCPAETVYLKPQEVIFSAGESHDYLQPLYNYNIFKTHIIARIGHGINIYSNHVVPNLN